MNAYVRAHSLRPTNSLKARLIIWPSDRASRGQSTLLPESLDDYVNATNPVRVVDVFVDELDLMKLGVTLSPGSTVKC